MADAHGRTPQPQPQPARQLAPPPAYKAPPPAPAAAPARSGPTGGHQPARLETTHTAALILRDADHEAELALGNTGPTRQADLIRAAQKVRVAVYEVATLAELGSVEWQQLSIELSSTLSVSERLRVELLRVGISSIGQELAQALERLATKVAPQEWAAAQARDAPALAPGLSGTERMEVVRGAFAAVRLQVAALKGRNPDDVRKNAVAAVEPIQYHLEVAADALLALPVSERMAAAPDVDLLAADLGVLEQVLVVSPSVPWNRVFASVFDTENQLRAAVGRLRQARFYTGTVDPQAALQAVTSAAEADGGQAPSVPQVYPDHQSAVNGIALEMRDVFELRLSALHNLKGDLREPPPPKEQSVFETLLEIAVSVALSSVAGGLGALVADKLKSAVEKSAKAAIEGQARQEAAHLTADARKALVEDRLKSGALTRAVAVDSVKDASKQLLRDSVTTALTKHKPSGFNAREPLNAFIQYQERVLQTARHDALSMVLRLAPALAQLDLEVLNSFVKELERVPSQAYDRQYDTSLREWQNFRARLASPSTSGEESGDPNLDAPWVNNWSEQPIPGVLEVGLSVRHMFLKPTAWLSYLVLRGGEANAIAHLKRHPRKLGQAGLNRQYQMSFIGWEAERSDAHELGRPPSSFGTRPHLPTMVKVGVGVRDGFQPGSLRPDEMRLLKLLTSGDVTPLGIVAALILNRYDAVPDAVAIALAKQLIAQVDDVTTERLED